MSKGAETPPQPLIHGPEAGYTLGISDAHAMLIGRALAAWSQLEQVIEEVIWSFLELHIDIGRVITADLDANHKLKMLRGLSKNYIDANSFKLLDALIKRLRELYEFRNYAAHGVWVTLKSGNIPAVRVLRAKVPDNFDQAQVVLIEMSSKYMNEMTRLMDVFRNSLIDLRTNIHSSRGTSFPPPRKT
jgi:hypothetical protein